MWLSSSAVVICVSCKTTLIHQVSEAESPTLTITFIYSFLKVKQKITLKWSLQDKNVNFLIVCLKTFNSNYFEVIRGK